MNAEALATLACRPGICPRQDDLLPDHPWVRTADWTYLRFHGPHALTCKYVGAYTGRRLWRIADRVAPWAAEGDVYAYLNNDDSGNAVTDAQWLRGRLDELIDHQPG